MKEIVGFRPAFDASRLEASGAVADGLGGDGGEQLFDQGGASGGVGVGQGVAVVVKVD